MQSVPIKATANQSLYIQLGGQSCQINVYQKDDWGLFLDLYVNNLPIIVGTICENLNRLVRSLYLGFIGDLTFYDTQGADDPVYTGLGTRFLLIYIEASDFPAGEG